MDVGVPIEHVTAAGAGVDLHAVLAGPDDGELVILAHGFPEFWYGWRHQIPALANAGYRVLVPDMRGYNESEKPTGLGPYRIDRLADDIAALVSWAGREKAHLIGHDWGGAVSWVTALNHPDKLHSLTNLNIPHFAVMRDFLFKRPSQTIRSWYMFMFQVPKLADWYLSRQNYRALKGALYTSSNPGSFDRDEVRKYVEAWSKPGALTAMLAYYRAMMRKPPRLPNGIRVKVPTMLVWGAQDTALSVDMAAPSIALCERGRLEEIPMARHFVQHDEPELVNDLLLDWLGGGYESP